MLRNNVARLKRECKRLKMENKALKAQLIPISEIDFGWGKKGRTK